MAALGKLCATRARSTWCSWQKTKTKKNDQCPILDTCNKKGDNLKNFWSTLGTGRNSEKFCLSLYSKTFQNLCQRRLLCLVERSGQLQRFLLRLLVSKRQVSLQRGRHMLGERNRERREGKPCFLCVCICLYRVCVCVWRGGSASESESVCEGKERACA